MQSLTTFRELQTKFDRRIAPLVSDQVCHHQQLGRKSVVRSFLNLKPVSLSSPPKLEANNLEFFFYKRIKSFLTGFIIEINLVLCKAPCWCGLFGSSVYNFIETASCIFYIHGIFSRHQEGNIVEIINHVEWTIVTAAPYLSDYFPFPSSEHMWSPEKFLPGK